MEDKVKLDKALRQIMTESDYCKSCIFKHGRGDPSLHFCFFAYECLLNNHAHYKEKNKDEI